MTEWTEEEINRIVGIKSKGGFTVDIFNSYIGVYLYVDNKKNNYLPEGIIRDDNFSIILEDFSDCETENDVTGVFNEIVKNHLKDIIDFL